MKIMKIFRTIQGKMVAGFGAILIGTVIILGIITYMVSKNALLESVKAELDNHVTQFYIFLEANPDMDFNVIQKLCNEEIVIGEKGFIFVVDPAGNLLIHKHAQGENWAEKPHIKKIIQQKNGQTRFFSPLAHAYKIASYKYLEDFNWIIVASAFENDFLAKPRATMIKTIVLAGLLITGFGGWFIFYFSGLIARGILNLAGIIKKVAEGDLSLVADKLSNDEIADAVFSFNALTSNFGDIIFNIRGAAEKVSTSSQEFSATAQEVSATASEVANSIQIISKGIGVQAQQTEDVSKNIEETVASMKLVTANSRDSATASEQASEQAHIGGDAVRNAVDKMTKVTEVVNTTATVIKALGERSQEIGEITDTISSIADQTNLLALNAAIEAARAGDAGRGFTVVAEEIRKLAESSAEAAYKINQLIKGIQKTSQEAVDSSVSGFQEVVEGRKIVENTSQTFNKILESVEHTTKAAKDIVIASEHQLELAEKVKLAMKEVARVAEQSSNASTQTSASVEEQTASIQQMSSSSAELAHMAVGLKEMVDRFKLNDKSKTKVQSAKSS